MLIINGSKKYLMCSKYLGKLSELDQLCITETAFESKLGFKFKQ